MNRLRWLITVPVAIVVVVFAVNNRGDASVDLWPFDLAIVWPLFAFVFIGAGVGFVLGAALMWLSSATTRRRARERGARVRELERALEAAERDAATTAPETPPGATANRLPARTD